MIAKSKHARALAIEYRDARRLVASMRQTNRELAAKQRELAIAKRDLESARTTIRDALPVYVRAQEMERHHFGQQFVLSVAFNPHCIWRASFDVNLHRHGGDVYELDSHARWVAQDAAEKIHHTIMDEIRKQTGIPGGPYGRF
jgi:hypothetical protein